MSLQIKNCGCKQTILQTTIWVKHGAGLWVGTGALEDGATSNFKTKSSPGIQKLSLNFQRLSAGRRKVNIQLNDVQTYSEGLWCCSICSTDPLTQ
jgi:hypothetical protein